jgi:hypothetical protein
MAYRYADVPAQAKYWKTRWLRSLAGIRMVSNEWHAAVYDREGQLWDLSIDEDEVHEFLRLFGIRFILVPVNVDDI